MMLALLATAALAQDADFQGTAAAPDEGITAKKTTTTLSAELGGMWTSGNAQTYTLNAGANLGSRWQKNKISAVAGANVGAAVSDLDGNGLLDETERDEGYTANARRVFGEVRYDRFLTEKDSLYGLVGAFHDIFAGFDLRSHEQVGYSRLLVNDDTTTLRAELGVDVAQEWRTTDEFAVIPAARLLLGATHKLNENVSVAETFELYENVIDPADLRILNAASLSTTLSSKFSLKLSHSLIFDNVPVEGFRKFDQTTAITLVASLL